MKSGTMDLPLHPGKCPAWLFSRMRRLAQVIPEAIIAEYGAAEFLRRISDPLFFQALGCALAFDWHSSGVTTTVCGALKEGLADTGIRVCGGKGKASLGTGSEITEGAERFSLSSDKEDALKKASRLTAKVDSSCVQDGYSLYHHVFMFDEKGNWAVVQQGMNGNNRYARRYHWVRTDNFVDGPPENIAGLGGEALNLVSGDTPEARAVSVDLVKERPERLMAYFSGQRMLTDCAYSMPEHHPVLRTDLTKADVKALRDAYEYQPKNYEELVLLRGMGGKKLRALALVANLVYGTKLDWKDPVKYSFAHGGKDGFPYPVNLETYENTIIFVKDAVESSKLGNDEKRKALVNLSQLGT